MKKSPWFLILCLSLSFAFLIHADASKAESARATARLFEPVGAARAAGPEQDRPLASSAGVREQEIRVNFESVAFAQTRELDIPLFDGQTYRAVRGEAEGYVEHAAGGFTWRGKISGEDGWGGDVILSVKGGAMSGLIYSPGAVYEIVPQAGPTHVLVELDQSRFPACGGAISPDPEELAAEQVRPAREDGALPTLDDGSQIDVMVVYTAAVRAALGGATQAEAFALQAVNTTNTVYLNSGIVTRLRLVSAFEGSYADPAGGGGVAGLNWVTADPAVAAARDAVRADMVALLTENATDVCGVAWIMSGVNSSFAARAFSLTQRSCAVGNLTFPHELGHNQACNHDRGNANQGSAAYPYAFGYWNSAANFRTVMSYATGACLSCPRVPFFSTPLRTHNGAPLGIAEGSTAAADNARVIQNTALTISQFRDSGGGGGGPANNNFAIAQILAGNSGSVIGSNVGATKEAGEPNHAGNAGGASVWYQWQAPASGSVTFATPGSNFNTLLAVYTGSSVGSLTQIASNDDAGPGVDTSSLNFNAVAGTVYRVAVDGWGGATGTVGLGWNLSLPCTYSISPSSQALSAAGGNGSISVSTAPGCAWTAVSNSSFITVTSGGSGTGSGSVGYTVAANTDTAGRTGTITAGGQTFTVTQPPGNCPPTPISLGQTISGTLSTTDCRSTSRSFSYADSYSFSGTAGQMISISMTSTSFDTYLFLYGPSGTLIASDDDGGGGTNSRIPSGSGAFTLPATGTYRIETASFGGDVVGNYAVSLAVGACTYSLSPGTGSFGNSGGTGSFFVNTGGNCPWTAVSNDSFITVTSGASGAGGGSVSYTVAPNLGTSSRTGTITAGGQTFTVTQASNCVFSISPTSQSFTPAGGTGSFSVSTQSGCPWTAVSNNSSFITVTSGGSGTGNGTVTFTVAPNQTPFGRNGSISVGGRFFDISQTAVCSYTLSPAPPGFPAVGGTASIFVSTGAGCGWTAVSNDSFITVISGASGSGSGSVAFSVAPNTGTSLRRGTLTVAGQTITVPQLGHAAVAQFPQASLGVDEHHGRAQLTVNRTGDTSVAATVNYATANDSADRRRDYTQTLGTLDFAPGETSKTISVYITDDVFPEPAETFLVVLSTPNGMGLGEVARVVVTINDNDTALGPNPVDVNSFSPEFFVRQHYVDFLNREPDAAGLQFWTDNFTQCRGDARCMEMARINVSAAFFLSIEFQETGYFVYRMFKTAHGDAPSPGVEGTVPVIRLEEFLPDAQRIGRGVEVGVGDWFARLEANKTAYALEFAQRQRFLNVFPASLSPTQFVDGLNQKAGGVLSAAERTQLINELTAAGNTTTGRAAVFRKVAEDADLRDAETRRAFVYMQYVGYLRRNPDDPQDTNFGGWKFWLDKLNLNGGDYVRAEMVKAFIESIEYKNRFGQ